LSQKKLAPTSWLAQLLAAEIADREARSYQYQLRLANFPVPRDLDSFDFRESVVSETQIRQLYTGEYLNTARNIVFVGGTGTGKTHLSTALARHAIQQGKRARFYSINAMRARHPGWFREDLQRLFGLLATGAVRPRVAERISFDEIAEAHR